MKKQNTNEFMRNFVFSAILKSLNFNGARMIFPYPGAYACIDGADLLSIVRWDVDVNGNKRKPEKKPKALKKRK